MGKKKSAKDSLSKLSRGLTRETPARRGAAPADGDVGGGGGARSADASAESPATQALATEGVLAAASASIARRGRPRTKPERMVRVSVDVVRSDHEYLRDVAYDAETDAMSVMRALLRRMKADPDLEERIREDLADRSHAVISSDAGRAPRADWLRGSASRRVAYMSRSVWKALQSRHEPPGMKGCRPTGGSHTPG